jgi:flagellar motor switch protein FliN/FliY
MADTEKLQSFGEETAPDLAQALTGLLGRDVAVSFAQVSETDSGSVGASLDGPYLFSNLKGLGGVDGQALIMVKEKDASIIADLLIGQDGTSAPEKMTELHLSAFGEVVHQVAEIFTRGARKLAGSKALWEVGETTAEEPPAGGMVLSQLGGALTVFSFNFFMQDLLSSELLLCLPEPVAARLASGGGTPAAAAASSASVPAGFSQSGVSSVNTQPRAGGAQVEQLENEYSGTARPAGGNIGLLLDVPLKLTVELGRTTKLVKEILALAPGSVVELDKLAGEAVDILVNEKLIAKGEVVVIDENFGVRITEIINPEERLNAVQG